MTKKIQDIWSDVRKGDLGAWRTLVTHYEALVNTVALRTGLSESDAEDCSQNVWISLYRNRHSIKDPLLLAAWLIRTTRRRAVRMQQQRRHHSQVDAAMAAVDEAPLPDEEVMRLQQQTHLEIALAHLDERCRHIIELLFLAPKSKSYDQIARELGIPPNSLGPTRTRCLNKLRKILDDLGYL